MKRFISILNFKPISGHGILAMDMGELMMIKEKIKIKIFQIMNVGKS